MFIKGVGVGILIGALLGALTVATVVGGSEKKENNFFKKSVDK